MRVESLCRPGVVQPEGNGEVDTAIKYGVQSMSYLIVLHKGWGLWEWGVRE